MDDIDSLGPVLLRYADGGYPTDKRSWHHVLTALVPLIPADKFAGLLIQRDFAKPRMFQGQSVH